LKLNQASYQKLSQPSVAAPIVAYSSADSSLYGTILDKYMTSGITGVTQ
jgi:hypothetical protein